VNDLLNAVLIAVCAAPNWLRHRLPPPAAVLDAALAHGADRVAAARMALPAAAREREIMAHALEALLRDRPGASPSRLARALDRRLTIRHDLLLRHL
jgi:hypothetical protein